MHPEEVLTVAKTRDDAPTTASPTQPKPGGSDFKSLVNDALSQIVTSGPEGQQVQGAPAGPQQSVPPPVQQPEYHVPQQIQPPHRPMVRPAEDHSLASYRDMLRQEEERIAQRPDNRQMPPMPPAMNAVYGVPQGGLTTDGKIRYKATASRLLIDCYETLSRAVAGGMIAPYGTFYRDVQRLVAELATEVVDTSPIEQPKTEQPK